MKQIEKLENEIRELEKTPCYNRDFEKIEALKNKIRELENEVMEDLEW